MKNRLFKLTILILLTMSLFVVSSCSYNFSAGVSGTIYEKDGKTGFGNVLVFAYTSQGDRDADFSDYTYDPENPTTPIARRCNFRTKTNASGAFTVDKIVWSTSRSAWGRDDDVCNVYLWYYNDDFGAKKAAYSTRIVSGSTNESAINERIERLYYTIPTGSISGHVRTTNTVAEWGNADDDGAELELYFYDASSSTPEWKGIYTDLGRESGKVKTSIGSMGEQTITASHGNFTSLGQNTRMKVTYGDDGRDTVGYVRLAVKLVSHKSASSNVGKFAGTFKITTEDVSKVEEYSTTDFVNDSPVI